MDRVSVYIKKLIVLILSAFLVYFLFFFLILPVATLLGFLVLAFLNYKLTGEKPEFLFGLKQSNDDLNEKGGFWLLLKWFVLLFGLVYDILVWTLFGIYVLFMLFIDFFVLVNTIVYWMIFALLWFLKLFVPALVFLFRIIVHYLVMWPWWIYKLSFESAEGAVNRNMLFLAFRGALIALFLAFLFLGAGLLVNWNLVWIVGMAFAILPVVWAYGEIAALRKEGREFDDYKKVKARFSSGYDAVRAVLFYLSLFILLILTEYLLNMLGWIPDAGFTLLGVALNLNTFISLILLFVFIILVFAKCVLPPHVVEFKGYRNNLKNSRDFLSVIGRKFLRYTFAHIPGLIIAFLLAVIPAFLIALAVILTLSMKNAILDEGISSLEKQLAMAEGTGKYRVESRIRNYEYYKNFPLNVIRDFTGLKQITEQRNILEAKQERSVQLFRDKQNLYNNEIDSLTKQLSRLSLPEAQRNNFENTVREKRKEFNHWKQRQDAQIQRLEARIDELEKRIVQLPLVFLTVIIWLSLSGAFIFTVLVAYFGNLYHALYVFREDGRSSYFTKTAHEINQKDKKQPLLGFTLLLVVMIIMFLWIFTGIPAP